MFTMEVFKNLI